jgi:hypothetical protein
MESISTLTRTFYFSPFLSILEISYLLASIPVHPRLEEAKPS